MRRLLLMTLALVTVGAAFIGAAQGAGRSATRLGAAYRYRTRVEAARLARMDARAVPRGTRAPSEPRSAAALAVRDVQQIGEDGLHQGEQDTQTEPDVAMDPGNPSDVVAVTQQGRFKTGGSADSGFSASLDGGATWTHGNLPGLTKPVGGPFDRSSDATVTFGADHAAYASTLDFTFGGTCPSAVGINVSTDGGQTWSAPVFPEDDANCDVFNDKNWLSADTNPASPFFGRQYLVWTLFGPTSAVGVLRYSDDGWQTWSGLIDITAPQADPEGLLPLIASDGDVTVVYDAFVNGQDFETAQTSTDGGLTWGSPVTIAQSLAAGDPGMRTGGLPAAAIDPSNDRMDVVWQDTRFRSDGHNDVVLSSSTDGGATWSAPARVNGTDPNGQVLDHFTPAVAAGSGNVFVSYRTRDFAGKRPSEFVDQRAVVSTDGGATFGAELIVAPPSDLKYAAVVTGGAAFLGDYSGLATDGSVAHAAWSVALFEKKARYHQTTWGATLTP